jgi:hypothetical protein
MKSRQNSANIYSQVSDAPRKMAWAWRVVALVILTAILISLITYLTVSAHRGVFKKYDSWWGPRYLSTWEETRAIKGRLHLSSAQLVINITGDELTAHYGLAAPIGQGLMAQALASQRAETGNDMVDNILGDVSVGQFRYGLMGQIVPLRQSHLVHRCCESKASR